MSFMKKLATYLLGVGLGVVVVYFMFGDRTDIQCNYFPNDRVLYDLRLKDLEIDEELALKIQGNTILDSVIDWTLVRGRVDFENSEPRKEPCGYYLIKLKEPAFQLKFENCDSTVKVLSIDPLEKY